MGFTGVRGSSKERSDAGHVYHEVLAIGHGTDFIEALLFVGFRAQRNDVFFSDGEDAKTLAGLTPPIGPLIDVTSDRGALSPPHGTHHRKGSSRVIVNRIL